MYRGLDEKEFSDESARNDFFDREYSMYEEFQRLCYKFMANWALDEKNFDWDTYILMQNHGAPTRILDWTDGALISLHFAIKDVDAERKENEGKEEKNPRVYVLNPYSERLRQKTDESEEIQEKTVKRWKDFVKNHPGSKLNEEEWEEAYLPSEEEDRKEIDIPEPPLLLLSPHLTPRLGSQRTRMILFGKDPFWFKNNKEESFLQEIEIDRLQCERLLVELKDCGITESVIFPDLDGLGREIAQYWKVLFKDYKQKREKKGKGD
ncbi:FRG domain-containing protein [Candidatus Methylacidiphilum infernorum]|uniref:FRG domain-containing protein n=1 Tax=Candidatus Methylacidiphilum infernorum TaxID=511746 RepID=A0ABX7PXU5_9BACT|nr:FRG domain-containing protein [Candidatus Methylacidiphilum infernorum]